MLTFITHLILFVVTKYILPELQGGYNYQITKSFLSILKYWEYTQIFQLFIKTFSLKNKTDLIAERSISPVVTDQIIGNQPTTVSKALNEDYSKTILLLQVLLVSTVVYKFFSKFWYIFLIQPLRLVLGYFSLLMFGVDLNSYLEVIVTDIKDFFTINYKAVKEYFNTPILPVESSPSSEEVKGLLEDTHFTKNLVNAKNYSSKVDFEDSDYSEDYSEYNEDSVWFFQNSDGSIKKLYVFGAIIIITAVGIYIWSHYGSDNPPPSSDNPPANPLEPLGPKVVRKSYNASSSSSYKGKEIDMSMIDPSSSKGIYSRLHSKNIDSTSPAVRVYNIHESKINSLKDLVKGTSENLNSSLNSSLNKIYTNISTANNNFYTFVQSKVSINRPLEPLNPVEQAKSWDEVCRSYYSKISSSITDFIKYTKTESQRLVLYKQTQIDELEARISLLSGDLKSLTTDVLPERESIITNLHNKISSISSELNSKDLLIKELSSLKDEQGNHIAGILDKQVELLKMIAESKHEMETLKAASAKILTNSESKIAAASDLKSKITLDEIQSMYGGLIEQGLKENLSNDKIINSLNTTPTTSKRIIEEILNNREVDLSQSPPSPMSNSTSSLSNSTSSLSSSTSTIKPIKVIKPNLEPINVPKTLTASVTESPISSRLGNITQIFNQVNPSPTKSGFGSAFDHLPNVPNPKTPNAVQPTTPKTPSLSQFGVMGQHQFANDLSNSLGNSLIFPLTQDTKNLIHELIEDDIENLRIKVTKKFGERNKEKAWYLKPFYLDPDKPSPWAP